MAGPLFYSVPARASLLLTLLASEIHSFMQAPTIGGWGILNLQRMPSLPKTGAISRQSLTKKRTFSTRFGEAVC